MQGVSHNHQDLGKDQVLNQTAQSGCPVTAVFNILLMGLAVALGLGVSHCRLRGKVDILGASTGFPPYRNSYSADNEGDQGCRTQHGLHAASIWSRDAATNGPSENWSSVTISLNIHYCNGDHNRALDIWVSRTIPTWVLVNFEYKERIMTIFMGPVEFS